MFRTLLAVAACLIAAAACSPIQRKVTVDEHNRTTRTYFLGIPVMESREWSQDILTEREEDRFRQMEMEVDRAGERMMRFKPGQTN